MAASSVDRIAARDLRDDVPSATDAGQARTGPRLRVRQLGRVPYAEALALQTALRDRRLRGEAPDTALLLEHPDVVTYGRSTRPQSKRYSDAELSSRGYAVHTVARGGDATVHLPGQLVGYLVLDLSLRRADLHAYLRDVEAVLIAALGDFGLDAHRQPGRTGVFVSRDQKIASIGVGVRRWVTMHGFALNVTCDLERFDAVVPCGLDGVEMVDMARMLGRPPDLAAVQARVAHHLVRVFA